MNLPTGDTLEYFVVLDAMTDEHGAITHTGLITGSGAQDRDETLFGHKPFWVVADHLTRHGIEVLPVDDRGVGGSTVAAGMAGSSTSQDFANSNSRKSSPVQANKRS